MKVTVLGEAVRPRLRQVAEALKREDNLAVVGHVDPDLDSIGSVLALAEALRSLGKRCVAVSPDPDPAAWRFLPGHARLVFGLPDEPLPDVAVVVDTDVSERRLGKAWPLVVRARLVVNVDHHDTNNLAAHLAVVEPRAAATGELIYYLVHELGAPLTRAVAEPLYVAIMTDTGGFRFSNTRSETFRIAAELVDHGADPHELAIRVYDTRPWGFVQLLGEVLSRMQRTDDGRVAWITVPLALAEASGLAPSEMEGLVQYARMVEGVEVALLFKELGPARTRVSLRSQRYVDVAAIARHFGGGGHLRAAGCTVDLPLGQAVEAVVSVTREAARVAAPAVDGQAAPEAEGEGAPTGMGEDWSS